MSLVLYDYLSSGNGYKCRLVLKALGMPYEIRIMDIVAGATRTPEFLAINPNGRIPVLVVPGRGPIAESHAIISYLAEGSKLVPADPYERALMWQWMCFEQYQLEPGVATVRFWLKSLRKKPEELGEKYTERFQRGADALTVLERGLADRDWLVGGSVTLADIALFAYTHVADQAGYRLGDFPAIGAWITRFQRLPWYSPITEP
ncbi:MAG TPA: glutathione S-transferase family protein [Steroidobacteraceae bacterium]|nr:glutathione S-transferase family protein [Steroidobacteraceae bacterium]